MLLGVIGGMGPMATVYFYKMLTEHTRAEADGDHIDVIISGKASIPDRTAYILGKSGDDPAPVMLEEANKLASVGADVLVIPCNTAHYYLPRIEPYTDVPFINMVDETVRFCRSSGCKRVGIMSTEGITVSGVYTSALSKSGIDPLELSPERRKSVMDIIYKYVKAGKMPPREMFDEAASELDEKGADKIILACTELSIIKSNFGLDDHFVDTMEILTLRSIERCGKIPVGLDHLIV